MKMRAPASMAAIFAAATALAPLARADEFGCKVLLCILNPNGWSSVGECVPPVERALRMAARGKGWPQCPEAGSRGSIGYERWKPCPDGTVAVSPVGGTAPEHGAHAGAPACQPDGDGAYCARRSQSGAGGWREGAREQSCSSVSSRERRSEPNFIDLTMENRVQRFWFNLERYR